MNFFKKLFGLQEEETKISSKKNTDNNCHLNGMYPFYSKPGWEGDINDNMAILMLEGKNREKELYVNLSYINGDDVGIVLTSDMSEEKFSKVLKKAYQNLNEINLDFRFDKNFNDVLVLDNCMLACEKIEDKNQMLKAHKLLNADQIIVSIARRGFMFVSKHNGDVKIPKNLAKMHAYMLNEDAKFKDNQPLTKHLFILVDGEINSVLYLD